jgi:plasmid stability protein
MSTLTIRNLPDDVKSRLRLSAAANGHSMEEEARAILRRALTTKQASRGGLGQRIHARFAKLGGVELETPKRAERTRAPRLRT